MTDKACSDKFAYDSMFVVNIVTYFMIRVAVMTSAPETDDQKGSIGAQELYQYQTQQYSIKPTRTFVFVSFEAYVVDMLQASSAAFWKCCKKLFVITYIIHFERSDDA
jgi:hypothetical protein